MNKYIKHNKDFLAAKYLNDFIKFYHFGNKLDRNYIVMTYYNYSRYISRFIISSRFGINIEIYYEK